MKAISRLFAGTASISLAVFAVRTDISLAIKGARRPGKVYRQADVPALLWSFVKRLLNTAA
jgi:hypothetical protein